MSVKLLAEQHLVLLSLKGGCTGSSESSLVKMPHCWKSHVTAQFNYESKKLPFRMEIFFSHIWYINWQLISFVRFCYSVGTSKMTILTDIITAKAVLKHHIYQFNHSFHGLMIYCDQ